MVDASFASFWNVPGLLAWFPGTAEWIIIAAIGLILFGKKLPEVGRSLGKGIVEFKKGLKGIEEEVEQASNRRELPREEPRPSPGYKFDPYTGKPLEKVDAGGESGDTEKTG